MQNKTKSSAKSLPTPEFKRAWAYSNTVPGWYTEAEAELLWSCAREVRHLGPFLEIGSYRGRTASLLAQAAPSMLHVCEPFILAPGSLNDTPESEGRYISDAFCGGIAMDFVKNMANFEYVLWKCKSSMLPSDTKFSLVHVDADHVRGVFQDAALCRLVVASGGIAVFHDYEPIHTKFTRVKEAADELQWEVVDTADSSIAIRKPA